MASEVVDLFTELAALPSPPGEERAVADVVIRYLRDLGLSVDEDDAGPKVGSNIGNVYCRLEATDGGSPIFLCAHLDTVPPEGPIEPVIEDGVVRNAAGTILGADNKSAVAAMLEGARRVLAENRPHAGIELLFTPKEEVGLLGAYAFDNARLQAQLGYVYDHAGPVGEIILGAPWSQALEVRFHGKAAHSGMYPEEGRSAIQAAAKAIADLRLGRVDDETTANVGVIDGGTAGNIVPEWCTFLAEARAQDERKLNALVQALPEAFSFASAVAAVAAGASRRAGRWAAYVGDVRRRRSSCARRGARSTCRRRPAFRLVADVPGRRGVARRGARGSPRRGNGRDEDLDAVGRGGPRAVSPPGWLVRARRYRADPQSRALAGSSRVARWGAGRGSCDQARRDALRGRRVRGAGGSAAHRELRRRAVAVQPARAGGRRGAAPARGGARHRRDRDAPARRGRSAAAAAHRGRARASAGVRGRDLGP